MGFWDYKCDQLLEVPRSQGSETVAVDKITSQLIECQDRKDVGSQYCACILHPVRGCFFKFSGYAQLRKYINLVGISQLAAPW